MTHLKLLIFLSLISFSVQAKDSSAPTLKSVMRDLGRAMNNLNSAIFYEDYNSIAKSAHNIAYHPKPTGQLPTIVKTLGFRMLQFKKVDGKVHGSAIKIEEFAKKQDMTGILKHQTIIMNSCVACHSKFRKEISSTFK